MVRQTEEQENPTRDKRRGVVPEEHDRRGRLRVSSDRPGPTDGHNQSGDPGTLRQRTGKDVGGHDSLTIGTIQITQITELHGNFTRVSSYDL
ncbi:hypothetical protein PoB_007591700 [Plakobranchus ocellatus]|uniref:Uncharacterized protein n=1 Tax=Plakobranchus ocellatus TaxID=259542 RepID=A0AAV4DYI6_9GAST|nr:hypothetical protein PoB_007591700 [Plakobranchus ocellatus]